MTMTTKSIREYIDLIDDCQNKKYITESKILGLLKSLKSIYNNAFTLPGFKEEFNKIKSDKQLVNSVIKQIMHSDKSIETIKKIILNKFSIAEAQRKIKGKIDWETKERQLKIKVFGWIDNLITLLAAYVIFFGGPDSGMGGVAGRESWVDRAEGAIPVVVAVHLIAALVKWINRPDKPLEETSIDAIAKVNELTRK